MTGVQVAGMWLVAVALAVIIGGVAWLLIRSWISRLVDHASRELVAASAQAVARRYSQRAGIDDEHRRFLVKALARQLEAERAKLLSRPIT